MLKQDKSEERRAGALRQPGITLIDDALYDRGVCGGAAEPLEIRDYYNRERG